MKLPRIVANTFDARRRAVCVDVLRRHEAARSRRNALARNHTVFFFTVVFFNNET